MKAVIHPVHNLLVAAFGLVMVAGVYVDGWAHLARPGLETFFTPWHGILYSGFAALAALIVLASVRRDGQRWRLDPPPAYGAALLGVVVFLVGGVADMGWHEIFGIEAAIDALVSPTHLVLLVGGMLMVTAPMRAASGTPAVIVSVATTAALAGFFLAYMSVFADPSAVTQPLTTIPEGAPGHREAELPIIAGLGGYLVSTAIVLVPMLVLRRTRGILPSGALTLTVAVLAILGSLLTEFRFTAAAIGAIAGAAVFEAAAHRWAHHRQWWLALGAGLPVLMWIGQLTGLALAGQVAWTVELWAGVIILSGLAGAALALATTTPAPANAAT